MSKKDISSNSFIAELGIFAAVSLTGFFSSYFSSNLCAAGLISITRQPFLAKQISNITVIMQSLMQTPLIFGFIIALVIQSLDYKIFESKESAIVCLAAGLAISLGSLGPLLGSREFSFSVCESIGFNRHALTKITSFSVLSQAIIETPIIFSAILSFWIIGFIQDSHDIYKAYIFLLVALLLFVGNLGPGYNSGKIASSACKQIAINPHIYSSLSKTSMLAQGIIDTSAIYCFVISMCLIIFR